MSEIERIRRYIKQTGIKVKGQDRYAMSWLEALELVHNSKECPVDTIALSFEYGKAKGYRAAKAESRKEASV